MADDPEIKRIKGIIGKKLNSFKPEPTVSPEEQDYISHGGIHQHIDTIPGRVAIVNRGGRIGVCYQSLNGYVLRVYIKTTAGWRKYPPIKIKID